MKQRQICAARWSGNALTTAGPPFHLSGPHALQHRTERGFLQDPPSRAQPPSPPELSPHSLFRNSRRQPHPPLHTDDRPRFRNHTGRRLLYTQALIATKAEPEVETRMSTTPPRRPTRRNIGFTVHEDGPIARIAKIAGDAHLSNVITDMLNRYLNLIHRNPPKLSDRELCAVIDALGQTWPGEPHEVRAIPRDVMPAVIADRLDTKWAINAHELRTRLERSTALDRSILAEFCLAYWMITSEDEAPQVTLDRVRQLLQPSSPSLDTRPPIRRISASLFDQAESGTYPNAEADDNAAAPVSDDDPAGLTDQQSGASPNENSEYSA